LIDGAIRYACETGMSVGVVSYIVTFFHDATGEGRGGINFRSNKKKGGMKIVFGEICQHALSDSWGGTVIKGEGEAVAESWPTIDEVGIYL
jgi:hypothetical protein